MKKREDLSLFLNNKDVQMAMEKATIINGKHWLEPQDLRALLARLDISYELLCRYLSDSSSIRDGHFVLYFCLEDCLALAARLDKLEPGKSHCLRLPYRHDARASGYVSTSNYEG